MFPAFSKCCCFCKNGDENKELTVPVVDKPNPTKDVSDETPKQPTTNSAPKTTTEIEPKTTTEIEPKTTAEIEPKTTDDIEPKTTDDIEPKTTDDIEPKTTGQSTEDLDEKSTDERKRLIASFIDADTQGSGPGAGGDNALSFEEYSVAISKLGLKSNKTLLFEICDENVDGKIEKDEFIKGCLKLLSMKEEKIKGLFGIWMEFSLYDENSDTQDKQIDKNEFEVLFHNFEKTKKQADDAWNDIIKFDSDNDGKITLANFIEYQESIKVEKTGGSDGNGSAVKNTPVQMSLGLTLTI